MKAIVSGVLFVLLLASMFTAAFNVQPVKAAGTDWWPMLHHDLNRTGASTSPAPTTNNTLWTYTTGGSVDSSPAVVGGLVYVGSDDNNVYCLNATSGAKVWSYATGGSVYYSSPAVAGGLVYVGSTDGSVYCLDATTGAKVWSYPTSGAVESSPAVAGGLVYVGSMDDSVFCLNAATGAKVWSYATGNTVDSSPAVVGGLVYVGSNDNNVYCLDAATGAKVWNYTTGGGVTTSPVVVGGFVYAASLGGRVFCLNAATGALVWKHGTGNDGGGYVFFSLAVAGGLVYVGSGTIVDCLNATSGAFVWSYTTGDFVFSSPAVAGGLVYVGSFDGKVYCLKAATGALVWSYTTGSDVFSSPAVVNGVVYVGSEDNKIYAFGFLPPSVSISPTSVTMDTGQSNLFTSTVSGGKSPYSYQWYLNNAPVLGATSAEWTFTPTSSGSYNVYLNVTDSSTHPSTSTNSNIASATVTRALYIDPQLTQKTTGDVGKTFNVSVKLTDVTDLYGFDFNVTWDHTLLKLAGVDFNTTLDHIWGHGNWYPAENESGVGYYKLVAVSTAGSFTSTSPTSLATLQFLVEDPQSNFLRQTPIHFDTHKLSDSQANAITNAAEDGTYQISGEIPSITLNPTSKTCREYKENFTVDVNASHVFSATGFEFEIDYNTTLLNYTGINWNAWTPGPVTVNEAAGKITGYTSGITLSGNQKLITIEFTAALYRVWKSTKSWVNNQSGLIFLRTVNLTYSGAVKLHYIRGGLSEINVGPDVTYTFSPIQGDVDNNGKVNVLDLQTVAHFYNKANSTYDLNGDGTIDIYDLVLISANFSYTYP